MRKLRIYSNYEVTNSSTMKIWKIHLPKLHTESRLSQIPEVWDGETYVVNIAKFSATFYAVAELASCWFFFSYFYGV